jgi:L-iditol 2-dehydrogenase
MRAAVQHAPGELRLEERPVPRQGPGEVLVRLRAAGICGSDLHFWKYAVYGPGAILGHEVPGAMIDLAGGADEIKVVVEYDRH